MNLKKSLLLILLILLVDQAVKIYVKTHFYYGESYDVFSWFKIHFIENNGMAFGFEFGGIAGKIFLSVFRLAAIAGIFYWLYSSIKKQAHPLLIVAISLIFAGALGNIIDSVFYGRIFSDSYHGVAKLFDGTYAPWFQGRVVDMFDFPLFDVDIPESVPFIGGLHFTFFNAIFNVADSAITIGVGILIFFNKRIFGNEKKSVDKEDYKQLIDKIVDDQDQSIASKI